MQRTLVLDHEKSPLMPCHPARARQLLREGKAAVYRRYPFTIILKERVGGDVQAVTAKIDPGSKTTGLALVADFQRGKVVVWGAELSHKSGQVKDALEKRRAIRRGRRWRHTRYRPARFDNRRRAKGWLAPSLVSRLQNVVTWVQRLQRYAPVCGLAYELVKFDTQLLDNAEIGGVEYQQGELYGYEVREYVLEKWGRRCAYCGAENVPLEIEHIVPKSRGGSNRVSNLTLACHDCNQEKNNRTAAEFGHPEVQQQARRPLKDAAAVNTSRWALYRRLQESGLAIECGTGGRTKMNRVKQDYPKAHWIDAACVGVSGEQVSLNPAHSVLVIQAMGRGKRQFTSVNAFGFPCSKARSRAKRLFGFQTGDFARAVIPKGVYQGVHIGRIGTRASGRFTLGKASVSHRYCQLIQRSDGYRYSTNS